MDLQKHFVDTKDFRVKGHCLHSLIDILIIALLGTLADCHDFPESEDYAKDKEAFLREEVGLPLLSGIPSEDTMSRVVRFLNPTELEKACVPPARKFWKKLNRSILELHSTPLFLLSVNEALSV